MYNYLSFIYDEYMSHIDYEGWVRYLRKLLLNINYSPKSILEYGCGTGSITELLPIYFPEAKIVGLDLSEDMLTEALNKSKINKNLTYLKGDMREFNLGYPVELIICTCDTINHLKPKEIPDFFKKVYSELETPGVFLFDIVTEHYINEVMNSGPFIYDSDDVYFIWESEPLTDRVNYYFTFFVKDGEKYDRYEEMLSEYINKPEFIKSSLKEAGFSEVKMYNFLSTENPDSKTDRIQYIALKK